MAKFPTAQPPKCLSFLKSLWGDVYNLVRLSNQLFVGIFVSVVGGTHSSNILRVNPILRTVTLSQQLFKARSWNNMCYVLLCSQIAKFMEPTWGPPGSCWPQMGPMLAPWILLSGLTNMWYVKRYQVRHCVTSFSISIVTPLLDIRWQCNGVLHALFIQAHCPLMWVV